MWDPQKVQADLRSRFGFDELRAEQILNYSAELQEVCTPDASHTAGFLLASAPLRVLPRWAGRWDGRGSRTESPPPASELLGRGRLVWPF